MEQENGVEDVLLIGAIFEERSVSIKALAGALSKTQGAIEGADKDGLNPAFKSAYASIGSVWNACRAPLAANGLSVIQTTVGGSRASVSIKTILMHESGEYIACITTMPVMKSDPQGHGSAITYARRYALMSVLGICPEDDDGNAASESPESANGRDRNQSQSRPPMNGPKPPMNGQRQALPVQAPQAAAAATGPITEGQIKAIRNIANQKQVGIERYTDKFYQKATLEELTFAEASDFIKKLSGKPQEAQVAA